MLLLKCCLVFGLVSSGFSKLDLNLHLEEVFDKLNSSNQTFTWGTFNETLKTIGDSVLLPNLGGIYKIQKKLQISSDCSEALHGFVMGLRNGKQWAFEMFDATGKIPGGVLEGTMMAFGSFDECLRIRVHDSSRYSDGKELFRGQFCMVGFRSPLFVPMSHQTVAEKSYVDAYGTPPRWAHDLLFRAGGYLKRVALWFGTCIPSTCTEDDVRKLSSVVSKPLGLNVSISDCQVDEPFVWPSDSVAAVSSLGCLVALCATGTLCDVISRWRKSNPTNRDDDHLLLRIPKAFSLLTNTENLFSGGVGGGSLACFNGIRFLSATWIVLGHTYFYTDNWKYLKFRHLLGFQEQFNGFLPVAVIENFTVPVGSFFFMSGFLLVYTTWQKLEKTQGKLNLLMFLVHKFWRMTPALGFTMALLFVLPLIDSGPLWYSTLNGPVQQCRDFWWQNFLYINNWWDSTDFCLMHTWYLSALMQFHIVGILLLLVAYRWPIVGTVLGITVTVACFIMTALVFVWNNFPMPSPGLIKDMDIIEEYNKKLYIKSFTHFPTYLIGMVMAYILLKYHDRKIAPKYQVIAWIFAVLSALLSVYGLYGPAEALAVRALYTVGHRIGWALSLAWMSYACATGIGGIINRILSWNALYCLGQLSYLTYLVHPLIIFYRDASLRERVNYGNTELVFAFLSNLVVSLFFAFVGFITVETPFAILEKMIFKRRPKESFKKMEYREDPYVQVAAVCAKTLNP